MLYNLNLHTWLPYTTQERSLQHHPPGPQGYLPTKSHLKGHIKHLAPRRKEKKNHPRMIGTFLSLNGPKESTLVANVRASTDLMLQCAQRSNVFRFFLGMAEDKCHAVCPHWAKKKLKKKKTKKRKEKRGCRPAHYRTTVQKGDGCLYYRAVYMKEKKKKKAVSQSSTFTVHFESSSWLKCTIAVRLSPGIFNLLWEAGFGWNAKEKMLVGSGTES